MTNLRYRMLRRVVDQQVEVVDFAVHFDQLGFGVGANLVKIALRRMIASSLNIFFLYFVTETK